MKAKFTMGSMLFVAACCTAPAFAQFNTVQVTVAASATQNLTEAWRTGGFRAPESVAYDPASRTLLVSNLAVNLGNGARGGGGAPPGGAGPAGGPPPGGAPPGGAPPVGAGPAGGPPPGGAPPGGARGGVSEEPTDGYISQVGLDGKVIKERFVDGLDRPSGLTVNGGTLWVLAGDLVEVDLATQKIRKTYKRPEGAGRLTDVRVARDGRLFITDMNSGSIFVLDKGQMSLWMKEPQFGRVNGIVIDGGTLYVNCSGTIKAIDIATKKITPYGTDGVTGAGDDLIPAPGGLLAAAYQNTILVDKTGKVTQVLPIGVNGLEYVADQKLIVATFLRNGELAAYKAQF